MNRISNIKREQNSVALISCIREPQIDSASLFSLDWKEPSVFRFGIVTPTREYQLLQDLTNNKLNNKFFSDSIYGYENSFAFFDKKDFVMFSYSKGIDVLKESEESFSWINPSQYSTWTQCYLENEHEPKLKIGLSSIMKRFKKFATLRPGWDSYDGKAVSWTTISRAITFFSKVLLSNQNTIPVPFVAPLSDGGIQFEWKTCYRELVNTIPADENQPFEFLKIDRLENDREEEGKVFNVQEMAALITEWLLQNSYDRSRIY